MKSGKPLGSVIEGSLSKGLEVRLYPNVSVEDMRVGKFLVIQGRRSRFFGLLVDVALGTSTPRILANPPHPDDFFMQQVLAGNDIFGDITITPELMFTPSEQVDPDEIDYSSLPEGIESNLALIPVKTIPSHFSPVYEATEDDFRRVFGSEDDVNGCKFNIGQPLDMEVPICIDLNLFVERSNGIFGKSGTGKSFLTRLLLAGIISKRAGVNLMFDMHSEYGWEAIREGGNDMSVNMVKGLAQLFPGLVEIYTLDPESTKRRGVRNVQELYLGFDQIEIEDIQLIAFELNLSEASMDNVNILASEYGKSWIIHLLHMSNEDIKEFCQDKQGNQSSIMALQRKLKRLESLKYIRNSCRHNYIDQILQSLDAGKHVVIEFGSQSNMLSYMLATNMITRRIHKSYVYKAEKFLQSKNPSDRPNPLVITIEEAHRFLDPKVVHRTIFGTIAREMRKYFVTLLVVDQRPSGIDKEVMSQVGTRITCLLNDDKDIDAIFTGVSGSQGLRSVLAKLDSKQQALILGYAVPMAVVVRTRSYDRQFYAEIGATDYREMPDDELAATADAAKADLGF